MHEWMDQIQHIWTSTKSIVTMLNWQSILMGKNIIKGATQVRGHFLKLYFYMFERSQVKHNNLDFHKIFWNISLITKFTCSKFDTNQKCFFMFKALKPWEWIVLVFFKCPFFLPNMHHSFWKLEWILTLIRKAKWLKLMKIIFITNLSTFGSKVLWP
jgi:hypothetical protein